MSLKICMVWSAVGKLLKVDKYNETQKEFVTLNGGKIKFLILIYIGI
jgi:hypothetical protein